MSNELERLRKLESVVKDVLSLEGDDVCWRDVYTEMAALAGVDWTPRLLDEETFLGNCRHFHRCLASGEHYVSPGVSRDEIDRLKREVAALERAGVYRPAGYSTWHAKNGAIGPARSYRTEAEAIAEFRRAAGLSTEKGDP